MASFRDKIYKILIIPLSIFNICYGFGAKVYFFAPIFLLLLAILAIINIYILFDKTPSNKRQNSFLLGFAIFTVIFFCGFGVLTFLTPYAVSYYIRGGLQALCFLIMLGFLYLLLFHNRLFKNKKFKISIICISALIGIMGFLNFTVMKIDGKPVVFDAGDENYAIVFTTNTASIGSIIYEKDGEIKEIKDIQYGIKKASKVHKIIIPKTELLNATYYAQAQNAIIYQPHNRYLSPIKKKTEKITFRDLSEKDTVDFAVISDTHNALNKKNIPMDTTNIDFFVYLGDIVSFMEEERDLAELINILHNGSKGEAVCYYAVGNHEKRGKYSGKLLDYIVTPSGTLNYTFEYKDFLGIVMDTGEDHTDEGWIFNGNAEYTSYAAEQTLWLKSKEDYLVNSDKTKIFFGHVPFYDYKESDSGREFKNWIEILEKSDVKLILNGHDHRFKYLINYDNIEGLSLNIPNILVAGKTSDFTSDFHASVVSLNKKGIDYKNYRITKKINELKDSIYIPLKNED